jgi:phosphocarrier protein HPr
MISERVKVGVKNGIHLRLAGELVKAANKFKSEVMIAKDSLEVNAKSILGVAGLGAEYGSELMITVEGEDESDALACLVEMFEKNFPEETADE